MGNISPTFISGRVCPLNAHPCRGLAGDIPAGDVSSAQPALPRARDAPLGHSRAPVPGLPVMSPHDPLKGEGSRQRRPGAAELHPARGCGAVRGCSQPPLEGSRTALPGDRSSSGGGMHRGIPVSPAGAGTSTGGTRCRGSGTARPGPTRGGAAGAEPSPPQGAEGRGRAAGAPRAPARAHRRCSPGR